MNPYPQFVLDHARLIQAGRAFPLGGFAPCPRPEVSPDAPRVLIFSPHPDDEVIIGGLALRLMRECRWRVINVAVTQGSKRERQEERLAELKDCCQCIGFELVQTAPRGLEHITPKARSENPSRWQDSVATIAAMLAQHQPAVILFPHEHDWNATHIGTHLLVRDALQSLPSSFRCHAVETEFWGQMASPNLHVEIPATDLGDLITALTFHVGEVQRNPYHLTLPAWMQDNVRRGGELVGGQGAAAPKFTFSTLYRLNRWHDGRLVPAPGPGRNLPAGVSPASLFQ